MITIMMKTSLATMITSNMITTMANTIMSMMDMGMGGMATNMAASTPTCTATK